MYYPLGGGIAATLSKYVPGMEATAEVTGGSVDNLKLIGSGKPTGAERIVVLASFLLGGPSGSGVATTVTLGAVAWPMLAKAGYERNAAGGRRRGKATGAAA